MGEYKIWLTPKNKDQMISTDRKFFCDWIRFFFVFKKDKKQRKKEQRIFFIDCHPKRRPFLNSLLNFSTSLNEMQFLSVNYCLLSISTEVKGQFIWQWYPLVQTLTKLNYPIWLGKIRILITLIMRAILISLGY